MVLQHSLPSESIVTLDLSPVVKGQAFAPELLEGEREDRMNDQGLTLEHLAHLTWRIGA